MYNIALKNKRVFEKDISKIPNESQTQILGKIHELGIHGLSLVQIKKLAHYKICDYRLRVGDYRILFDLDKNANQIVIFRVLHRSKLY